MFHIKIHQNATDVPTPLTFDWSSACLGILVCIITDTFLHHILLQQSPGQSDIPVLTYPG